jgi:hypothetical protein
VRISEDDTDRISEDQRGSARISKDQRGSVRISERISERSRERIRERISDRISERISERIREQPGRALFALSGQNLVSTCSKILVITSNLFALSHCNATENKNVVRVSEDQGISGDQGDRFSEDQ